MSARAHFPRMKCIFFFQAEDGIRDKLVTGVQTCALPISPSCSTRRARCAWRHTERRSSSTCGKEPSKDFAPDEARHCALSGLSLVMRFVGAATPAAGGGGCRLGQGRENRGPPPESNGGRV